MRGGWNVFAANLLLSLWTALRGWQDVLPRRAVDLVEQLLQVGRLLFRNLAVGAVASSWTDVDQPGLEDLLLDQLVVLRHSDVPLPVPLLPSKGFELYRCDIVNPSFRNQPDSNYI